MGRLGAKILLISPTSASNLDQYPSSETSGHAAPVSGAIASGSTSTLGEDGSLPGPELAKALVERDLFPFRVRWALEGNRVGWG